MASTKKLLLIDDDSKWQETLSNALEDTYDIRVVGDESEFWEILHKKEWTPDVCLIDWLLNGTTSEELIRDLIKKFPRFGRIVVTSGKGDVGTVKLIQDLNCNYWEKGSSFDRLKKLIENPVNPAEQVVTELERKKKALDLGIQEAQQDLRKAKRDLQNIRRMGDEIKKDSQGLSDLVLHLGDNIPDRNCSFQDFIDHLLRDITLYTNCTASVFVEFKFTGDKVRFHDGRSTRAYLAKDLGKPRKIRAFVESLQGMELLENFSSVDTFSGCKVTEARYLIVVPVKKENNVKPLGTLLLFYKKGGKRLEGAKSKIENSNLSNFIFSARSMPFRLAEMPNLGKVTRVFLTGIRMLPLLLALLLILSPLLTWWLHHSGNPEEQGFDIELFEAHNLQIAEYFLLYFALTIFAIALVILYRPEWGETLPNWIKRLSNLHNLKRSLFMLVGLLFAMGTLSFFLKENSNTTPIDKIHIAIAGGICILSIGLFLFITHERGVKTRLPKEE